MCSSTQKKKHAMGTYLVHCSRQKHGKHSYAADTFLLPPCFVPAVPCPSTSRRVPCSSHMGIGEPCGSHAA